MGCGSSQEASSTTVGRADTNSHQPMHFTSTRTNSHQPVHVTNTRTSSSSSSPPPSFPTSQRSRSPGESAADPPPGLLTVGGGARSSSPGGHAFDPTSQAAAPGEVRNVTPLEIAQHNRAAGWPEWIPHKGKVYDGVAFMNHFIPYIKGRQDMMYARFRQRKEEGVENPEEETVFVTHYTITTVDLDLRYKRPDDPELWRHSGVLVARLHGVSEEELDREMPPFLMGTITGTSGPPYWSSVRSDVAVLRDDLLGKSVEERSPGETDFLNQLTRWHNKYNTLDPKEETPPSDGTDPNTQNFPLPVESESLRVWLLEWSPFAMEVPAEGARPSPDLENIDLGDPHENLVLTLRPHLYEEGVETTLEHGIEGEAAWDVLPNDDVVRQEVMLPEQTVIQAAREKRPDFHDPERMKRRRQQLCEYYMKVHEMRPEFLASFMKWADVMEANKAQLETLAAKSGD